MKRFVMAALVSIAAVFATVPAHAQSLNSETVKNAGFSKLSEAEKAEIVKMVADKATAAEASAKKNPISLEKVVENVTPTAEGVDKWLNVGEKFGKMIGGAARETGVAVNEFVKSPVGMLTAGLIVWNYIGNMLVHVIGAIVVMVVGLSYLRWMMNRTVSWEYEYDKERKNIFGNPVVVAKERSRFTSDALAGFSIGGVVVLIVSLAVAFSY